MTMSENLVRKVGERGQDNLIARLFPRALTMPVKIAAGEGQLKRGSLLCAKEDGTYGLYGKPASGTSTVAEGGVDSTEDPGAAVGDTPSGTPSAILVADVDASGAEAVAAAAYRCGNFNPDAVILGEGCELTAADKDALRKYDIIFTRMLED